MARNSEVAIWGKALDLDHFITILNSQFFHCVNCAFVVHNIEYNGKNYLFI